MHAFELIQLHGTYIIWAFFALFFCIFTYIFFYIVYDYNHVLYVESILCRICKQFSHSLSNYMVRDVVKQIQSLFHVANQFYIPEGDFISALEYFARDKFWVIVSKS